VLGLTGCDRIVGRYYYRAGEKLYFAGNYSEAIKGFDGSIKYRFQLRESFAMRGLAHYMKGEYDLAIADNNEALRVSPNYAMAYNGRGLAYYRKGEMDKTIADMEKVLEYSTDRELREPAAKILEGLKGKNNPIRR
jgi:tetratricopeptide (TPR) repeat protein